MHDCYFHAGASPSIWTSVALLYNANKDKLWIRSDDGTAWLGGFSPGSANTLENGQAKVHCALTTVQGVGDTLQVSWAIEFKPTYAGRKKTGLKCKDLQRARAKGERIGTWTVDLCSLRPETSRYSRSARTRTSLRGEPFRGAGDLFVQHSFLWYNHRDKAVLARTSPFVATFHIPNM